MPIKLQRDPSCTMCRLHQTAAHVCLIGQGPIPCEVMVIGEAPGRREDASGKAFVGSSGGLLEELLSANDFDRDDIFISNAVHCRPPQNRTPSKGEIKACKHWLDKELAAVRPKFVLLLGNVALQSITGKPGIKKRRGKPFEQDGRIYLPAYHPSFVLRDPSNRPLLERDIALFRTIVSKGEIPREDALDIVIVRTELQVQQMLHDLHSTVSIDIETTCLYPWGQYKDNDMTQEFTKPAINTLGFGTRHKQYIVPVSHSESPWSPEAIKSIVKRIGERLVDCFIVAHNGKFDFLWKWVHLGVEWYQEFDFDTMLAHYILNENSRHGLKELAQKFCGAPDWDVDADTKKGNASLERLALYQAHDLYYTRRLRFIFGRMLSEDPPVKRIFDEIMMPCARLFVEIEYDGVCIDITKMDEAEAYLRNELEESQKELGKYGDINWGSPKQLGELLFVKLKIPVIDKTPTGAASTSESVIKRIDHPIAKALLRFRAAKQQMSFFIEGWKPYIVKDAAGNHYLHPSFKLHGTVTGRLSCEHPNLQQVPRDKRIRSLIFAPPGEQLGEADLSQIELRIAAHLANEKTMIEMFHTGVDVHWSTALREIERGGGQKELVLDTARTYTQNKKLTYSECFEILLEAGPDAAAEINDEWKELRKKAKAVNFGFLFGMWWKKFKLYARDNYGVDVSDEQAQDAREFFFSTYKFADWHKRQRTFARRNGYVVSLSGRKRRLPDAQLFDDVPERREAERQAINSPVQGFANEINLMSALQLRREFTRDQVKICGTVHDAILYRSPDEWIGPVTKRLLQIMSGPDLFELFGIELRVPICAEAKIGPWSTGIAYDKWVKQNAKLSRSGRSC